MVEFKENGRRKMFRKTWVFTLAVLASSLLLTSACSTSPVVASAAKKIPAGRIYKTEFIDRSDTNTPASITFIRDSGLLGVACSFEVTVNGQKAFAIAAGETITLSMTAGEYILLMATRLGNPCPNQRQTKEVLLRAGESRQYRISTASNYVTSLTREK